MGDEGIKSGAWARIGGLDFGLKAGGSGGTMGSMIVPKWFEESNQRTVSGDCAMMGAERGNDGKEDIAGKLWRIVKRCKKVVIGPPASSENRGLGCGMPKRGPRNDRIGE